MKILALESSCDETSAAVVSMSSDESGERVICSNIIASQIDIHRRFGGVVPEIAGRAHIETISRITYEALDAAGMKIDDIDAIGVTNAPGLIGALLVGVNFAKSLAYASGKPLVPVNHVRGHIAAAYLTYRELKPPFLAFVASGGHTSIYHVLDYTDIVELGSTRDDAAGEAFDKAARVMGIQYPGGAEMERLALEGDAGAIRLPSPAVSGQTPEFSFSGLKTAVVNYINTAKMRGEEYKREDVAASFIRVICEAVCDKLSLVIKATGADKLVFAGGVAANSQLRAAISELCRKNGVSFYVPPVSLCGDNAAMIGAQAYYEYSAGVRGDTSLNAYATE